MFLIKSDRNSINYQLGISPETNTVKCSGIDNFELFAAMLESSVDGTRWDNYFAINVIGMVDAVDKENSMYNEVMDGEDGGMSSMGAFTVIALREKEIINFDFFREPIGNNLIISERALNKVVECFPNGGAGLIAHEVILT
ncbi:MAG: hypothetical protein JXK07_08200 [Spirochaetes bacterium]|nr:hypothetical protein [Spirochaetota bacterium]MBN2771683.1 hypothetical protein [Spirochaetota bacterium]